MMNERVSEGPFIIFRVDEGSERNHCEIPGLCVALHHCT